MKVTIMVFTFMLIYTYYLAQLNLQAVEIICDEGCDQDRVEETMTGSASECPGTGGVEHHSLTFICAMINKCFIFP
jgi:hypothetical protein